MKHADLCEYVKLGELIRSLVSAEGIPLRCLGDILAARVFVEEFDSNNVSI